MKILNLLVATVLLFSTLSTPLNGQSLEEYSKIESIAYGDMDNWRVRVVEESFVIGGEDRFVYEIASGDTIRNNQPYIYDPSSRSPWATSSVMAKVSGVTKASTTVFPVKRGDGYAAKCQVCMEKCRVLGLFNIQVVASGTIFLGGVNEPIGGTSDPQSKLITGIPFTSRPDAFILDINYVNTTNMIKATGFGKPSSISGKSNSECVVILQKRWEDGNGDIYAQRIAVGYDKFSGNSGGWIDNHIIPIKYGIKEAETADMPILVGDNRLYTRNSRGEVKPINELGWADADETPTHMIMRVSSSNAEVYTGALDSYIMVDNLRLGYK